MQFKINNVEHLNAVLKRINELGYKTQQLDNWNDEEKKRINFLQTWDGDGAVSQDSKIFKENKFPLTTLDALYATVSKTVKFLGENVVVGESFSEVFKRKAKIDNNELLASIDKALEALQLSIPVKLHPDATLFIYTDEDRVLFYGQNYKKDIVSAELHQLKEALCTSSD